MNLENIIDFCLFAIVISYLIIQYRKVAKEYEENENDKKQIKKLRMIFFKRSMSALLILLILIIITHFLFG